MSESKRARTKKDVVTEFRENEIIDAARRVIARDGLRRASMDKIAEAAGTAKGTLYLYFENKEALVREATARGHAALAAHIEAVMGDGDDPVAAIEAYIRAVIQFSNDHELVFRAMNAHPEAGGDEAARSVDQRIQEYVDKLETVIRKGVASGRFQVPNPRRAARYLVEAVRGLVIERLRETQSPSVEDDVGTLFRTYLNGISAK